MIGTNRINVYRIIKIVSIPHWMIGTHLIIICVVMNLFVSIPHWMIGTLQNLLDAIEQSCFNSTLDDRDSRLDNETAVDAA